MEEKLSNAAKNGNLEEVKRCVEEGQVFVDSRFPATDGPTALYWAACNGYHDVCTYLLVQGAEPDMVLPRSGSTPLHAACDRGHYSCVLLLLSSGSKIDRQTSNNGDTALHLAAYRGHANVCQLLLSRGANISLINKQGRTPLDEAYLQEHSKIIEMLSHLELECSFNVENSTQKKNKITTVFEDRIGIQHYYSERKSNITETQTPTLNMPYDTKEYSSPSSFIHQPTNPFGKKSKKLLLKKQSPSAKHKPFPANDNFNLDKFLTDLQRDDQDNMKISQIKHEAKTFDIINTTSNQTGSSKQFKIEKPIVTLLQEKKLKKSFISKDLCENVCNVPKIPRDQEANSQRVKELEDLVSSLNTILEEKEAIIEDLKRKNKELELKCKKMV